MRRIHTMSLALASIAVAASEIPNQVRTADAQRQIVVQQYPRVKKARPFRDLSSKRGKRRRGG